MNKILANIPSTPSWKLAAIPLSALALGLILIIAFVGPLAVSDYSPIALLSAAALALCLGIYNRSLSRRSLAVGLRRSATQILPAIPMLLCIAALATTWMISGVVPTLIEYGLLLLSPKWFLLTTCVVCSMISVITGSSWSTIATIGVAFIGIGNAMGYHPGWTAGAIISGAYFGDKVSPLSDTTVIASSTCGVDLFTHIRFMMITTVPAVLIALIIFGIKGFTAEGSIPAHSMDMLAGLNTTFNITPWVLVIPVATLAMIALKLPTLRVLVISSLLGIAGTFIFQPQLHESLPHIISEVWGGHTSATGIELIDQLASTGGIVGILPVVALVLSALVFGWIMISTGFLGSLATALTRRLHRPLGIVSTAIATGFTLNSVTADQYLSIIINGNMYRGLFRRSGLESRLLSRTLEDGVSVTSPIIPWSSCGVTQATVLGVPTLTYLPYCIFNYITPLVSMFIVSIGYKIVRPAHSRC